MDYRARRLRTTLLLGTTLLAGMAIGPVSSLIASYFVSGLAINAAPIEPIPTGCSHYSATYSSGCVVNTSIQSPTRT